MASVTKAYESLMSRKKEVGGCWIVNRSRRPVVQIDNRRFLASRIVAVVVLGLDPEDEKTFVCHTCDNPRCINPDHLYLGDGTTNARDRDGRFYGKVR